MLKLVIKKHVLI